MIRRTFVVRTHPARAALDRAPAAPGVALTRNTRGPERLGCLAYGGWGRSDRTRTSGLPSQRRQRRPRSTSPRPNSSDPRPSGDRAAQHPRRTSAQRRHGLRGGDHGTRYGKTTLLAEWAERDRRPFAWVSVDEADGDPVVFLGHVAVALDRIEPIEPRVLESIASPTGANSARVLSRLSSALATRTRPFVLVLDDLDRLTDPSVMDAVSTIAGSVPEGSALALAARALPDVGLPACAPTVGWWRWASRTSRWARPRRIGCSAVPACAPRRPRPPSSPMRPRMAGRPLPRRAVPAGAAALDGAADPVHRRRSVRRRLRSLRGARAAVRERQRFLTRTSILDRLNGSLCDAVMERSGSARTLESIERQNLLLVPLDRQREWYRYHNLFRDVLRAELARREPEAIRSCIGAPRTGSRKRACSRRLRACARERRRGPRGGAPPARGPGRVPRGAHRHPPPMARHARRGRDRPQRGPRAHGRMDRGAGRRSCRRGTLGGCRRRRADRRAVPPRHGVAPIVRGDSARHHVSRRTGRDVPRGGGRRPGRDEHEPLPGGGVRPPRSRDDDPRGR